MLQNPASTVLGINVDPSIHPFPFFDEAVFENAVDPHNCLN
jgi:hypothetical protein